MFVGKGVLTICSKFTGEHPCRSVISIKLLYNFIEITLRYGCSPAKLLHILRTSFLKNTSGRLLLKDILQMKILLAWVSIRANSLLGKYYESHKNPRLFFEEHCNKTIHLLLYSSSSLEQT